jgi:hypothetical protein
VLGNEVFSEGKSGVVGGEIRDECETLESDVSEDDSSYTFGGLWRSELFVLIEGSGLP